MIGDVSLWLVFAILIGASIALYDGFHRKWMTELETFGPAVPLSYTANKAAWVFAGVVLPFMLLHGRKLRLAFTESLLLWFVFCTVAYARDFAYFKLPRVPVYVTDVILVLALVGFAWPRLRLPKSKYVLLLAGFSLLGIAGALRGIQQHMQLTDVLRDLSVPVYALFALPALYSRRSKTFLEQFWLMILCGAVIATLIGASWSVMQPGMRRYVVMGMYVPIALLLTVLAAAGRQFSTRVAIPLMLLLGLGVVLCNARTVYVGLAVASGALLLTGLGSGRTKTILMTAVIVFCVMAVLITVRLRRHEDAQPVQRGTNHATTALRPDDNTEWRLLLWKEAGRRFLQHPVLGEGYGVPLTFELERTDTKPHNIYLYVFYKMGLVGGAVFLAMLLAPTIAAWRAIRKHADRPGAYVLRGLFVCQVFLFCWGALNPLIETPFLASIFWMNLGLMLRMAGRMESGGKRIAAAAAA